MTVIDCFRWRNTVGFDVALEAARSYLKQRGASLSRLMEYAKLCKVDRLITPYLEAMVPWARRRTRISRLPSRTVF
jgi:hypothetical protein